MKRQLATLLISAVVAFAIVLLLPQVAAQTVGRAMVYRTVESHLGRGYRIEAMESHAYEDRFGTQGRGLALWCGAAAGVQSVRFAIVTSTLNRKGGWFRTAERAFDPNPPGLLRSTDDQWALDRCHLLT